MYCWMCRSVTPETGASDTMRYSKTFTIFSLRKCQFYFLSYFDISFAGKCFQRNFLILTFMSKRFFKSLCQRERQVSFLRYNTLWTVQFSLINLQVQTSKLLGGHSFNILIQKCFSEEWKQIYQYIIKSKTTEGNSAAISFPWILYESFLQSIFVIFLHFPDLWNL